jgi:hypothetical protein
MSKQDITRPPTIDHFPAGRDPVLERAVEAIRR